LREREQAGFARLNHAVARAAQRGVNAENHFGGARREARGGGRGLAARWPREALLHLLKLLRRDSHAEKLGQRVQDNR
jgi:hypothetical protein